MGVGKILSVVRDFCVTVGLLNPDGTLPSSGGGSTPVTWDITVSDEASLQTAITAGQSVLVDTSFSLTGLIALPGASTPTRIGLQTGVEITGTINGFFSTNGVDYDVTFDCAPGSKFINGTSNHFIQGGITADSWIRGKLIQETFGADFLSDTFPALMEMELFDLTISGVTANQYSRLGRGNIENAYIRGNNTVAGTFFYLSNIIHINRLDISGTWPARTAYGVACLRLDSSAVIDDITWSITQTGLLAAIFLNGGTIGNISKDFQSGFAPRLDIAEGYVRGSLSSQTLLEITLGNDADGDITLVNCRMNLNSYTSNGSDRTYIIGCQVFALNNSTIYNGVNFQNTNFQNALAITDGYHRFNQCVFGNTVSITGTAKPFQFVGCRFRNTIAIGAGVTDVMRFSACDFDGTVTDSSGIAQFVQCEPNSVNTIV